MIDTARTPTSCTQSARSKKGWVSSLRCPITLPNHTAVAFRAQPGTPAFVPNLPNACAQSGPIPKWTALVTCIKTKWWGHSVHLRLVGTANVLNQLVASVIAPNQAVSSRSSSIYPSRKPPLRCRTSRPIWCSSNKICTESIRTWVAMQSRKSRKLKMMNTLMIIS